MQIVGKPTAQDYLIILHVRGCIGRSGGRDHRVWRDVGARAKKVGQVSKDELFVADGLLREAGLDCLDDRRIKKDPLGFEFNHMLWLQG